MKSTKYQLLHDDYLFVLNELKKYKEIIERQRKDVERYGKALDDIKNLSTLNEYADADINGLLNACYQTANKAKPTIF